MKKFLVGTFALALVVLAPAAFAAGSKTGNIDLAVTVINNCTITTTNVAFPGYDPLSAAVDNGTGTVVITCTKNAPTTIYIDDGLHFSSPNRRLSGAASEFLNYEIYKPSTNAADGSCAYTTRWGGLGSEFTPDPVASKTARTYNVCAQIPASQDVSAGAFNDTVVATVNF